MKIDICSDLHVDKWGKVLYWPKLLNARNDKNDILVIAGDTSDMLQRLGLFRTLKDAAKHYSHVFFTEGNHEHYGLSTRSVQNTCAEIQIFTDDRANITYLNESYAIIDDVAFVGANGWYDWKMMEYL